MARMAKARLSYTDFFSMSRKSWKMTPSVRRIWGTCRGVMLARLKPFTITRPSVGAISAVISLMRVDLPDPDGPTRKTNSPSSMRTLTPFRALVPLSYSLCTSIKRIIPRSAPRNISLRSETYQFLSVPQIIFENNT